MIFSIQETQENVLFFKLTTLIHDNAIIVSKKTVYLEIIIVQKLLMIYQKAI